MRPVTRRQDRSSEGFPYDDLHGAGSCGPGRSPKRVGALQPSSWSWRLRTPENLSRLCDLESEMRRATIGSTIHEATGIGNSDGP